MLSTAFSSSPLALAAATHALQLPFRLCALESSVTGIPEFPLTHGFPFRKGVTTEIAQDDLLKKTLRKKSAVSKVSGEGTTKLT